MRILIVGNGGREHAFAWKISQSPLVSHIFVAPGNAGTALEPRTSNVNIAATAIDELLQFAKQQAIDLTLVGPELPLSLGIVDRFKQHGLLCFGPSKTAAQLESSKCFAKAFMTRFKIPTARYAEFDNIAAASAYLTQQSYPLVIKADGLASGKGVVIAYDAIAAQQTVTAMLSGKAFGVAGQHIIIEEFLTGVELSFIVMSDGNTIIPWVTSQDHKARDDGDSGPNTGGMGAYSPAPFLNDSQYQYVMKEIIQPTLNGLKQLGIPYCGFLYAGLMITTQGKPKVLEFNCRCGDPETQSIMMRLQSDLVPLLRDAAQGKLLPQTLLWDSRFALNIVMSAQAYPAGSSNGAVIQGLPTMLPPDCKIFHSSTALNLAGKVITNGGRILTINALAADIASAQRIVYPIAAAIHWDGGVHYRHDIGNRVVIHHE